MENSTVKGNTQISFDLNNEQKQTIEASKQSTGKISVKPGLRLKTGLRAGPTVENCAFYARNAPFAPEHVIEN